MDPRFAAVACIPLALACAEGEELGPLWSNGHGGGAASIGASMQPSGSNRGTGTAGTATGGATSSEVGVTGGAAGVGSTGGGGGGAMSDSRDAALESSSDAGPAADGAPVGTPKAEAGPAPTGIALLYKCTDTNPSDSQVGPSYRIVNTGGATANLADFKIRYFLSAENKAKLLPDFLYAEVNGGAGYRDIRNEAAVTVSASTPAAVGADTIVELGFKAAAGTLGTGQTMTVNFVVHTEGYASNVDESNDYSHDLAKTDFGPNPKVTLYYKDQLVAGTEP